MRDPIVRIDGDGIVLGPLGPEAIPLIRAEVRTYGFEMPEDLVRDRVRSSGEWDDHQLNLGILRDGFTIGTIQAFHCPRTTPGGVFEVGVVLFDAADRGRGLGAQAVRLLTRHLFEREQARRVQLTTSMDNEPMRRVAERLGFTREGVLRQHLPSAEGPRDAALYAMTKDDYEEAKSRWT